MNRLSRLFLAAVISCPFLLFSACGSKPLSYTPTGGDASVGDADSNYGRITEESGGPIQEGLDATGGRGGAYGGEQSDAYKREHGRSSPEMQAVYFQFDSSGIEGDQRPRIEHNGAYLRDNSSSRVLVEGNTDDRGTNEYNLALGERRAQSARKYLIQLGIEASRIRTVSYGEERPLFLGQSEDDYAHNRRDDFILE